MSFKNRPSAASGNWDEAARYYQQAADLEPGEQEARDKLRSAKQHQAADRVKIAKQALAAGHPRDALRPAYEATQLDPASADAKATFEQAGAAGARLSQAPAGREARVERR